MQNAERIVNGNPSIVRQQDGSVNDHYADETGDVIMTGYPVFPGIEVVFKDVHTASCVVDPGCSSENILQIEYCREGRAECHVGEEFFYLTPGDIAVWRTDSNRKTADFPMSHYHGVSIVIDMDHAPNCLNSLMTDVDVELEFLIRKFELADHAFHVLRRLGNMERIFSEMYAVSETIRTGYLKVKVLEVLLLLTGLEKDQEIQTGHGLSRVQVNRAKRIHRYVLDHLCEHMTIEKIAEQFEISPTNLKYVFRGVYGTSVKAFVRSQRMELAAKMLLETDSPVADIAETIGYINASKFSSAFQRAMGVTPKAYREKGSFSIGMQN